MLSKADMMAKIQQLYREDRPIPYLTFMHVFNDLLENPRELRPKEPCDELRETFRAACMCAAAGIFDREGRADQRLVEFREKICPRWKEKLGAEQFLPYEDIMEAAKRRRARAIRDLEESQGIDDRSRELLRKLGLVRKPGPEAAAPPTEEPAPAAPPAPDAPASADPGIFENVDELNRAIRHGSLKDEYGPLDSPVDLARYRMGRREVTVRLVRTGGMTYVILTAPVSLDDVPNVRARLDGLVGQMGYTRRAEFAYIRKDKEFTYTAGFGPHVANMACLAGEAREDRATVRRINLLHRELGELLEKMRS